MRKNGMLLGNVTNLVIAVLALIAFGVFVYKAFMLYSNQEEANAQKTLEFLEGKINALHEKENNTFLVQGFEGGEDWVIAAWSTSEGEAQGKPDRCFSKSCICVCNGIGACQTDGYCKFFDTENIEVYTTFEPANRVIGSNGEIVEGTDKERGIIVGNNVQGIYVEKEKGSMQLIGTREGKTVTLSRPIPEA